MRCGKTGSNEQIISTDTADIGERGLDYTMNTVINKTNTQPPCRSRHVRVLHNLYTLFSCVRKTSAAQNVIRSATSLMLAFLFFCVPVSVLSADEVPFELTIGHHSVPLGTGVRLELAFNNSQSIPAPQLPSNENWQAQYHGPSRVMSIVNGQMSRSVTHSYTIVPLKVGTLKIGPFRFEYKGDTYVSNEVELTVTDASQPAQAARFGASAQDSTTLQDAGLGQYVFLQLEPAKTSAYINEKVPIVVKLYINRFALRDIQYPQIEHEGVSLGEFESPRQYQQLVNGMRYEVIEFQTTLYGTRSGIFALGPATLECSLLSQRRGSSSSGSPFDEFFGDDFFGSFFGRYEKRPLTVTSPAVDFTVRAMPDEGKPEDFTGTVGRYDLQAAVGPDTVRVGDPVTLKMTISGHGNFDTVKAPRLATQKGFKVYEPQVTTANGSKVFEQILMPTDASVSEVPAITFSFFDTERGAYRTLTKGPFAITVEPARDGSLKIIEMPREESKPVLREVLGRDIVYVKSDPGSVRPRGRYLYRTGWFIATHGVLVAGFIGFVLYAERKERLATDSRYRRRLHAPRAAKKGIQKARQLLDKNAVDFYDTVFKTLQEYIGNLFHLPSGGITADVIDSELRTRGVSEEIVESIKKVFAECDMVRYAPGEFNAETMKNTFETFTQIIDHLERHR